MPPRLTAGAAKASYDANKAEYQSLADFVGSRKSLALLLSHVKSLDLSIFQHSDAVHQTYSELLVVRTLGSLTAVINQSPFI